MFHSYLTLLIPSIVAFVITVIATLFVIGYMKETGMVLKDMNKKGFLPTGGGIALAFGFSMGLLTYAFGSSFSFYIPAVPLVDVFAVLTSVLLITIGGFLDELFVENRSQQEQKKHKKVGLKQWQRPLFTLLGAIPLIAINAGISTIDVPFIGMVSFGLFYPLIILPIAVIFVSNAFNLLGGFDGMASGSAVILSAAMLIYSLLFGNYTGALLSGILFSAVLAFFLFHIYPAKIIPGDSFTFGFGAALLSIMVLSNMEAFGIIIFLPWFVEFFLHMRKRFKSTDLGIRMPDGTLKPPYGNKIYSWTHIIMNIRGQREWEVSAWMWGIEILFVLLAFGLKFASLL